MNFKKILSITLAVFLIVSLLSACKGPKSPTIENSSSNIEEETEITLADTIEKTDVAALYKLGTDIKVDSSNLDILVDDRNAHIFFDMGDSTQVVSFSVFENKVLGTATITGSSLNYGILSGGQYYVINLDTATLFVFDQKGEMKNEIKFCDAAVGFAASEKSGQYIVYQRTDSKFINRYDALTKETKQSEKEYVIAGEPAKDREMVYIKDQMGKHYQINIEGFTFKKTNVEAFREYVDCVGFGTEKEYFTFSLLKNSGEKYMAKILDKEEKVITAEENRFITVPSNSGNCFRIYSTEAGMATEQIKTTGIVLDAQFIGGDYVFVACEENSENYYRLFNIKEGEYKEPLLSGRLDDSEIYKNLFGNLETETAQQAQTLSDEYGIRFFYGETGEDFKTQYTYSLADSKDVAPKLKVVERVFEMLPSELLLETTADREIWVYLCSKLDNKGAEYSPLAVQTELYNHKVILIDASCSDDRFAELLCHEFAHILDDYMPQSVKDGFSKLTPEDIKAAAYTNDYTKISSDQYTPYDTNKDNVWFYNNYCRINEEEDRTGTLGQMFTIYVVQSAGEGFSYENVGKKAGYLSNALEETFDYCKGKDMQMWELAFPYEK